MISEWWETQVDNSVMRIYSNSPEGNGPFPGILVIMHQGGVDQFVQEMCRRLAGAGYLAAAPDLYHRDGPECEDDPPTRRGRLRDATIMRDVNAAADALASNGSADADKMGILGFCMGGRIAYLMAAENPALKVCVSYYGGHMFAPWGKGGPSPFELSAKLHCPVLGHFGEDDKNPSPEDMRKLESELERLGKPHEFYAYKGAGHAFMDRDGGRYRLDADAVSWPRTINFFAQTFSKAEGEPAANNYAVS